ncbi:major facilitator superfamily domain-containing protein [Flammula alnicola]|nr:major facilitator superfamily domain-containing protein [Flammula alnicola]
MRCVDPFVELPPTALESQKAPFGILSEEVVSNSFKVERLRWRLASGFFAFFMCGWGDGVTGTVLPHFMEEFHISFMMSSLLYAGSTLGFMTGTLLVESIIHQFGRFDPTKNTWSWMPKTAILARFFSRNCQHTEIGFSPSQARLMALLVSSILHALFFVMMGSKGGFWVLFWAYALAAFARSILTGKHPSKKNAYFASVLPQSIGYAYGVWSFGGVVSPLVCQALMAIGVPWYRFYFGSLVLSAFNTAFLVLTYKPTATEFLRDCESAILSAKKRANDDQSSNDGSLEKYANVNHLQRTKRMFLKTKRVCLFIFTTSVYFSNFLGKSALRLAITQPYQWAVCIFSLLYCGCETTTQSFHANPETVGYVTSGFWGGITIGRFVWGHYTPKLTYTQPKCRWQLEAADIPKYTVIGLTMQILIWTVNSNIENAFSTSIVGLVYGPVFPACLALANDILPSEIRMVSMALISATGSVGGSLFPFLAGTISSLKGIHTMTYITVPLAAIIACLWSFFPSKIPS